MGPRIVFLGLGAVSMSAYYYHHKIHDHASGPSPFAPLERLRPQSDVNLVQEAGKLITESSVSKSVNSTTTELKSRWNDGVRWLYGCLIDSSHLRDGIAVPVDSGAAALNKIRSSLSSGDK
eukprot:Opistho-2@6950